MKRWVGHVLFAAVVLSGCGGGGGGSSAGSSGDGTATESNTAPIADAGTDQNVKVDEKVTLDGSASRDADGDTITFSWGIESKPSGSNISLDGANTAKPTFTPDVEGEYTLRLVVKDKESDSAPDSVNISATIANSPPVAAAGPDKDVITGEPVQLDGRNSTDADGDLLTYEWSFVSRPPGSAAELTDQKTVKPTFTPDLDGEYRVSLIVSDGTESSVADEAIITATTANAAPTAAIGPDQDVIEGATVHLDGSASTDANGDELSYMWQFVSRPVESTAVLEGEDTVNPHFVADQAGTYVIELVVHDGELPSAPKSTTVTVTKANIKPIADAGSDQNVIEGALVILDGSQSSDPDGDTLAYDWRFVSLPAGSAAELDNTESVAPTFTADLPGDYVLALIVNDGESDSDEDRVSVTASAANSAPVAEAGADQNVITGTLVSLDGSASHDADGDSLSWEWRFSSRPGGSTTSLVNAYSATPSFTPDVDGTYVLELIVNDGTVDSDPDTILVDAQTLNNAPVADAGVNQSVYVGQIAQLDGSGSHDPEGDALTYSWHISSLPSGSTTILDGASTPSPSLSPDLPGDYVVKLTVNDGEHDSNEATVRVEALAPKLVMEQGYRSRSWDPYEWQSSALPYSSTSNISRSCSGSCGAYELAKFRLQAKGQAYTLRNVQVTNLGGALPTGLNPRFTGISENEIVAAGETVEFSLVVDHVAGSADIEFAFDVEETGKQFRSRYTLNLR